jgi:signal peptidase I
MDCPRCGGELLPNSRHCIECGSRLDDGIIARAEIEKQNKEKTAFSDSSDLIKIAVFSIIYPGLGHIIFLKDYLRGAFFAFSFTAFLIASNYMAGTFYFDMPLLLAAYLIYSLSPAHAFNFYRVKYNVAGDYNYRSSALVIRYFIIIAATAVFVAAYSNYQYYYNYVITVETDLYSPVFRRGDRVLVKMNERADLKAARGDILLFNLNRAFYAGNNVVVRGQYFEKVIGIPGETIKFDTEEITVNGKKLADNFFPLNGSALQKLSGAEFLNDKDQYLIIANGVINAVIVPIAAQVKKDAFIGRIHSIAWPYSRRKVLSGR